MALCTQAAHLREKGQPPGHGAPEGYQQGTGDGLGASLWGSQVAGEGLGHLMSVAVKQLALTLLSAISGPGKWTHFWVRLFVPKRDPFPGPCMLGIPE